MLDEGLLIGLIERPIVAARPEPPSRDPLRPRRRGHPRPQVDRHLEVLADGDKTSPPQRSAPFGVGVLGPRSQASKSRVRSDKLGRPPLKHVQHGLAQPAAPMVRMHVVIGRQVGDRLRPDPTDRCDLPAARLRDPPILRRSAPRTPPVREDVDGVPPRFPDVGRLGRIEEGLDHLRLARLRMPQDVAFGQRHRRLRRGSRHGLAPYSRTPQKRTAVRISACAATRRSSIVTCSSGMCATRTSPGPKRTVGIAPTLTSRRMSAP